MTRLYALAKHLIENTPTWPSGHSITIWSSGAVKVNVESGPTNSGRLDLVLYNSERHRVQCGYLNPLEGWKFTLDRATYAEWVARCGGRIKPTIERLPIRLCCPELRAEFAQAGGIG